MVAGLIGADSAGDSASASCAVLEATLRAGAPVGFGAGALLGDANAGLGWTFVAAVIGGLFLGGMLSGRLGFGLGLGAGSVDWPMRCERDSAQPSRSHALWG